MAGATVQFSAVGTYSDGTSGNITTQVTWYSSNTSIASISNSAGSNGLATASSSAGSTDVTAGLGGVISSADVLSVTAVTSNTMNIYLEPSSSSPAVPNIPYVTVYIDGNPSPIHLLLDTGATGIMINSSALFAAGISLTPTANMFSGYFGDGGTFSGTVQYASIVSTALSGGLTAQDMPVAVADLDTDFPSGGFLQGDFGMGMSKYASFGMDYGYTTLFTPSFAAALSDANYDNGFIIDFGMAAFTSGIDVVSNAAATPVGTVTFGLNTETDNMLQSGSSFYANAARQMGAYPMIASKFGGNTRNPYGYTYYSYFDTGSNNIYLGPNALADSISGWNPFSDVIASGSCSNMLYGGLTVVFFMEDDGGGWINNSFITQPNDPVNDSFCDYAPYNNFMSLSSSSAALALENNISYSGTTQSGQEVFGLPFIYNRAVYWQASPWGIGIEPGN